MSELRTNKIYPRDGLPAGASGGGIIQVVYGQTATQATITATTYQDIGLSATITPTSASNKILIMCQIQLRVFMYTGDNGASLALIRTVGGSPTTIESGSSNYEIGYTGAASETSYIVPYNYLDSPATTSACTYKVQGRTRTNSGGNKVDFQDDNYYRSAIILMEVSG